MSSEESRTADLILYKPLPEAPTLHILYVKDINELKSFANIWQCPICKEYFSRDVSHRAQDKHIEGCKAKHHIKALKNVKQLYKEMNKRRGYNYDTTYYPNEYYESFIGHECLMNEDMDGVIHISPYYNNLSKLVALVDEVRKL